MNVFVAWSGGKDCMLALNRTLEKSNHQVKALVNMCSADGVHSGSHGLSKSIITEQAKQMGIPIIQQPVNELGYETCFKQVIEQLKKQEVTAGVFGDIYLKAHRDWIERVCSEMDITPLFPLWENNTEQLFSEFIDKGFKSLAVSINTNHLTKKWLGRELNQQFLDDIKQMKGIDACAENGEYHSFVYDGPLFKNAVNFSYGNARFDNNHWLLPLIFENDI